MKDEIRLTFVGDIMCQREQNAVAWSRHGEFAYDQTFTAVTEFFAESDYVIGNLETPIAGSSLEYTSESSRFNTPETFLDALKNAGIDFLSTANNHCLDRGVPGVQRTLENLQSRGFGHTGTYATRESSEQIFIKEISGIKIALLSFTYGTNSEYYGEALSDEETWRVDLLRRQPRRAIENLQKYSLRSLIAAILPIRVKLALSALFGRTNRSVPNFVTDNVNPDEINLPENHYFVARAKEKIQRAKNLADFVILLPHLGGQYNPAPGEYHKWTMQWMSRAGVDAIIANHAHTPLRCEKFGNSCIGVYALGNFCFTPHTGWFIPNSFSEYGIVLDMFISTSEKKITRITYNVVKTILEPDGFASVHPVSELIANEKNTVARERLLVENEAVVNRFGGVTGSVSPQVNYTFSL
ncbi:CapA family protein [Nitrosomonas sp.]|uniref:CapA family protein n=1 Tax=Nitrosomonas sp. TaxID=42353 RepID=UPI0025FF7B1B|nr:CapA family protein [Nitrosomonas sp.]